MDFHAEFEKSIERFPSLVGLIFADMDGESILFENPDMDTFDIKLAGAKMPILMSAYPFAGEDHLPKFMEISYRNRYVLSVVLKQYYSITLVGSDIRDKGRLKHHLQDLAAKFNQDIY
jgi:hypothetical protein